MAAKKSKADFKVLQMFRFPPEMVRWLASQSEKRGKTKTRLVEEAIRAKMVLKGDA